MKYLLKPANTVGGEIIVPGDKSISHRALMLGAIANGVTHISGFLEGEDCLATLAALQKLGVRIERPGKEQVRVQGVGLHGLKAPDGPLDMGNAGTAIRLFMGLLSPQRFSSMLVGDASLMRRPMERVAAPLRMMGANIKTHNGCPPVEITGGAELKAIHYALPVASAQVKSAVLLAGLYAQGATRVTEPAPTRDHTERMLAMFGGKVRRLSHNEIEVMGEPALEGGDIAVPGDFSSAAFFLVAGCLAAKRGLMLRNVGINPTRTGLLNLLRQMGADIRVHLHATNSEDNEPIADVEVHESRLRGIEVPQQLVPLAIDELPVFFVAAACAEGETLVRGAQELRVKESDRLAVMAEGLTRLGVKLELLPDGMRIEGTKELTGGTVESDGDHRAAMSFAVASLRAKGNIEIDDVANVATSFPNFLKTAHTVGLKIEVA